MSTGLAVLVQNLDIRAPSLLCWGRAGRALEAERRRYALLALAVLHSMKHSTTHVTHACRNFGLL